jgi:hypothetical protein
MPTWWSDVEEAARVVAGGPDPGAEAGRAASGGRPAAAPERWRLVIGGFDIALEVVEEQPPHVLTLRVSSGDQATFGGLWTYEVEAAGPGSRVRLTEDGWIGPWPLRTVTWFTGYHTSIDSCLASLGRRFAGDPVPRRLPADDRPSAHPGR